MPTAKVNILAAHGGTICASMPDRQPQVSYRRVNAPTAATSLQFGRASALMATAAPRTPDGERAHAVRAHVAERHGRASVAHAGLSDSALLK
jgi:hypothetical protein